MLLVLAAAGDQEMRERFWVFPDRTMPDAYERTLPEVFPDFAPGSFSWDGELDGRRILVTAAGTQEPIDPVRFIGNRSSGKMGYAIAEAAASQGAEVTLVSGPTALPPPAQAHFVYVTSAAEMANAVRRMRTRLMPYACAVRSLSRMAMRIRPVRVRRRPCARKITRATKTCTPRRSQA